MEIELVLVVLESLLIAVEMNTVSAMNVMSRVEKPPLNAVQ